MDKLLELIITGDDRRECLRILDDLSTSIYKTDNSAEKILKNSILGQAIENALPKESFKKADKSSLQKSLSNLSNEIKATKTVEVVLAISPTTRMKDSISYWGTSVFKEKVIFEIYIKPEILGGLILMSEGKYYDYSLLTKLSDAFTNKRSEIFTL